jgi:hypothetical protein
MKSFVALCFYIDYKCSTQPGFRKMFLLLTLAFVLLLWSPWRPLLWPVLEVCPGRVVGASVAQIRSKTKHRLSAEQAIQIPAKPAVKVTIRP